MRRRRKTRHTTEPSLFPFLAVLICTMGALVVLLVLVVQQARVQASMVQLDADEQQDEQQVEDDVPTYDGPTELELQADHAQWRVETLQSQREDLLEKYSQRRSVLAHLEEHIRELEDQARILEAELQGMGDPNATAANWQQREAELERRRQAIAAAQQELEKIRSADQGQPAFAIIPFRKGNGTRRRPIYLECVEDGVIIQPEGVRIKNEDFEGALGPGNPLDAALRAIRDYWKRNDPVAAANAYPLLIVRPKGTVSYIAGRAAIAAWDDEFGYELIDADMKLAFPPKNSELATIVERAIADARTRQQLLSRAMPSNPQGGGFVVSRSGGLVPLHGAPRPGNRPANRGQRSGVGEGEGGDGVGRGRAQQQYGQRQREATQSDGDQTGPTGQTASTARNGQGQGGNGQQSGVGDPLAATRGANWALPGGGGTRGTPYTNPIRIAITPQAIVLLPHDRRRQVEKIFAVGDNLTQTVDQLVEAIHQRIESWGVAPSGGYWQPELHIEVAANGEQLTQQVETLLNGSGLTWKRSRP